MSARSVHVQPDSLLPPPSLLPVTNQVVARASDVRGTRTARALLPPAPSLTAADCSSIRDATKALQSVFFPPRVQPALPNDARRMLQQVVDQNQGRPADHAAAAAANQELKTLWEKCVRQHPAKLGAFAGVLHELRPAIVGRKHILDWWLLAIKPVILGPAYKKTAVEDAQDFLLGAMVYDDDDDDNDDDSLAERAKVSAQLRRELFDLYIDRTQRLASDEDQKDAAESQMVAERVESILVAFGKKRPQDFCKGIDDLVQAAASRVQALTLLGSFLRLQTPHLYLVANTPLVGSLLKCLMNDTSTMALAVALNTLIMLLPHIPGSLGPHLPRLFLVYSRLLCWEKFSPFSTETQKNLVTDDRVDTADDDERDPRDVGIDPHWEKVTPVDEFAETSTPEIKNYFTFLYGMYPLNFMSYIRRPRKYLKTLNFPGSDDFDLDQAIIRARTDQFRELHRLHPNFYHMTIEEELDDPKWPKSDPSDVVAECHGLVISPGTPLASPGPPPTRKLPGVPPLPPYSSSTPAGSGRTSPVASYNSFRHRQSWREPLATGASSPSRPLTAYSNEEMPPLAAHAQSKLGSKADRPASSILEDFPLPGFSQSNQNNGPALPQQASNIAHLQQQITLLTNELSFEKWHKAQYSQHISQLARKNVKDATAEAETLNLINANRALKQQMEHIRHARDATLKDSALTRKQASSLEQHMTDRFRTMKKEQEAWKADAAELRRLRDETSQYRDLLVACEARELSKSHELEIMQRNLDQLRTLQDQLKDATKRLREYEYRDFEFDRAKREADISQKEKETLQMKLQRREQEADRAKRAFSDRIAELEAQMDGPESFRVRSPNQSGPDPRFFAQQAEAESQAKLIQLKKAYSRLLERYTDLELECQSVKSKLELLQARQPSVQSFDTPVTHDGAFDFGIGGGGGGGSRARTGSDSRTGGGPDSAYDSHGEYNPQFDVPLTGAAASDPTGRRFHPHHQPSAGPLTRGTSVASTDSTQLVMFNQTAPLDDAISVMSKRPESSLDSTEKRRMTKVQPSSEFRVYGRGGAQNIKVKSKDKEKEKEKKSDPDKVKSGFKGLRKII